jgi:hypothetical protein
MPKRRITARRSKSIQNDPSTEFLLLDRGYNSAIDLSDPRALGFRYEHRIAEAITAKWRAETPLDGVSVGGGAFTLPHWLEAVRPGSRSGVLEVDPKLVEFDRQRLGLRASPQLRAIVGDGRLTMGDEPTGSADVIVRDAFSSRTVPWQSMTTGWLHEVGRVLGRMALYALNVIDLRRSSCCVSRRRRCSRRSRTFAWSRSPLGTAAQLAATPFCWHLMGHCHERAGRPPTVRADTTALKSRNSRPARNRCAMTTRRSINSTPGKAIGGR